jgi:RNA polymerase sigma factor (sigma-70 family)
MSDAQNTVVPACPQLPFTPFSESGAIEQYRPLAERIARRIYWRCRRFFDLDDLTGYAHLGLVRAVRRYTLAEALEPSVFVENVIREVRHAIQTGTSQMSTISRATWRKITRGLMAKPTIYRGVADWEIEDAMTFDRRHWEESDKPTLAEMLDWLRQQDTLLAEIVELHVKDRLTMKQVGQRIGRSRATVNRHYSRAINELTRRFNPAAWRPLGSCEADDCEADDAQADVEQPSA